MFHKIKLILYSLKRRGIIDTIRFIISELVFDLKYQTNTSNIVELKNMTIKNKNVKYGIEYCASNQIILNKAFYFLNKNYDLEKSSLLDYGCGKGRVLIFAKQFKFKKIIGVEFAQEVYHIASQNISNLKLKNIEIFNQDATKFKIENGINIFYFYNPFIDVVMEKVIDNIEKYILNYKKKVIIVYVNPICIDMFISRVGYKVVYQYKDEIIILEK